MRSYHKFAVMGAACVSMVLATSVYAQDELDELLDLASDKKAEIKPAEVQKEEAAKPAEEVKPAAEVIEEKKEDVKAEAVEPAEPEKEEAKAEEMPAEEAKPAEPAEEEKAEEAKPAEPVVEEAKAEEMSADEVKPAEPAEEVKAEEAKPAEPVVEEAKAEEMPAEEAKPAEPAEEVKAEEAKPAEPVVEEAKAEEMPADEAKPAEPVPEVKAEEKPVEEAKPVEAPKAQSAKKPKKPAKKRVAKNPKSRHPQAALISDIATTERLRREALDRQAAKEMGIARAAMVERDWETAYQQYNLANTHLNDRADSATLRKECREGMAEAKYQAAKQAVKDGDRDHAIELADEAVKLRHPRAAALRDSLEEDKKADASTDVKDIKHRRNDADYKKDRDEIRNRLRLSAQYLAVADLNNALDQCDLVLRSDPYNQQAIALRDRIQRKREMIIEKEREAARKGMIADVGAAWRPVYAVNSAELKNVYGGTSKTPLGNGDSQRSIEQSIEKRMKEMILPSISFRPPATIIDAVDYFRQASKDYDRPEVPVDQRGFNFVLQLDKQLTGSEDAGANKKASNSFAASADDEEDESNSNVPQVPNISASNVSLAEALKLVCKVTGFKYKVQGSVVMVMPKGMTTDELITRSYSVIADFVDRMSEASSSLKSEKSGDFGGGDDNDDEGGSGDDEAQWKALFESMGVTWPQSSHITYIKPIGKLRVTNTEEQLSNFEDALNELNVTPKNVEIETRFVEVAQEDLNSLGFEWLLNSDYSFNVGGKVSKALNLKDGNFSSSSDTTTSYTRTLQNGVINDVANQSTTTQGTWSRWDDAANGNIVTTTDANGNTVSQNVHTGNNMGVNAVDGSTYSTGMRYLSSEDSKITNADGTVGNDKFMKVNAFLGNADLSMILHMLSQRSDTDLLSAPKVVTLSGQEATIKVVTIYRYPQDYDVTIQSTSSSSTSSISTTGSGSDGKILPMVEPQNFETQEVGVILVVTPEVTPEGLINLALNPKVISEPTWKDYGMKVPMASVMSSTAQLMAQASGEDDMNWFTVPMEQPFFKERSIDTKVSLYNGSTIVMGGLITEERKSMEDKIPFLGDIPYIGRLFRSRSEWSNKRNLLMFVTARLVDPNGREIIQNQSEAAGDNVGEATPAPVEK